MRNKAEGRASAPSASPLCGKLFDETGDRLTPSHARTRAGARLRYCVSRRLMTEPGVPHPDGWRLPAPELQDRVGGLVRAWIAKPELAATLIGDGTSNEVHALAETLGGLSSVDDADLLALIERIDLAPGAWAIPLGRQGLADRLGVEPDRIDQAHIVSAHPSTLRKHGVETRLVPGETIPARRDEALVRAVARSHAWFERLKAGKTFAAIARQSSTSARRVQHMIGLAVLAPDIVESILAATRPPALTSDRCKRYEQPDDWDAQRAMIAAH